MANIRKSFNFRNGVQVDNDNFVVNPNGLVGIGTTIPTEIFDVRGTAKVTGLVTATDVVSQGLNVTGVATANTLSDGFVKIQSGIITAVSPTGVVTFHGDGVGLINIPTSQWIDIDIGLGFTSIYAAGNVGVGTTDPRFSFQIGGNPDITDHTGVGINSETGDIISTGVVTATSFVGSGIGVTQINADNIESGTLDNARLPADIDVSSVKVSIGFTGDLTGNVTGDVVGNVTGNVTGDLSGNINSNTNVSGILTATDLHADRLDVGLGTFTTVSGTSKVDAGVGGTGFTAIEGGLIGIGTNIPTSELQIIKSSGSLVEIVSESGQARLSIGQQLGAGTSTAVFRFGNQDNTFDIINNEPGDIRMVLDANPAGINTGNFTWHHQSTASTLMTLTYQGSLGVNNTSPSEKVSVGGGITATEKSYFGNGIEVTGTVKATTFDGTITLPSIINNSNINSTAGVSTFAEIHLFDNVGLSSIGINTNSPICAVDARGPGSSGVGFFKFIGIATDKLGGVDFPTPNNSDLGQIALDVAGHCRFNSVGLGTTANYQGATNESFQTFGTNLGIYGGAIKLFDNLDANDPFATIGSIGFNTSFPRSSLDMGLVAAGNTTSALILPSITTATRNLMYDPVSAGATVAGSMIYNSSTNKFQGYNGTSWVNLG